MLDWFNHLRSSIFFPSLEQIIAVCTLTTAAVAAYIAYRQHKNDVHLGDIERQRLLSELFDRRFEVFKATQDLLIEVVRHANCEMNEINQFTIAVQKSYFLFDDDLYGYLEKMRKNAIELSVMSNARDGAGDEIQRSEFSCKATEALKALIHEFEQDRLMIKFKKYMRLNSHN